MNKSWRPNSENLGWQDPYHPREKQEKNPWGISLEKPTHIPAEQT